MEFVALEENCTTRIKQAFREGLCHRGQDPNKAMLTEDYMLLVVKEGKT